MKYFLLLLVCIQMSWAIRAEEFPISLIFNFGIYTTEKTIDFYGTSYGKMLNLSFIFNGDTIHIPPKNLNFDFDGFYVSKVEDSKKQKFISISFFSGDMKYRSDNSYLLIDANGNFILYHKMPLEYIEIEPIKINVLYLKEPQVFDVLAQKKEEANKIVIDISAYLFKGRKKKELGICGFNAFAYSKSSKSLITLSFGSISKNNFTNIEDISVLYNGVVEWDFVENVEKQQPLKKKRNIDSLLQSLRVTPLPHPQPEKKESH